MLKLPGKDQVQCLVLDLKYNGNDNLKQMGVRGRLSEEVSLDWKISALYMVIRPLLGPAETTAQLVRQRLSQVCSC